MIILGTRPKIVKMFPILRECERKGVAYWTQFVHQHKFKTNRTYIGKDLSMKTIKTSFKGRISIIGSRGIPAKYGGFETCVEAIAPSLVEKGWRVWVSCERGKIKTYKNVSLFYFFLKPFYRVIYETLYDIYSLIFACLVSDIIYMLGYGSGLFVFIPKIFGKKLILNTDGMEWTRDKYSSFEKHILLISEKSAVLLSDVLIADSTNIQNYFRNTYGNTPVYITNGATEHSKVVWQESKVNELLDNINIPLSPGSYWLVVARLEPENNIHVIVDAFIKSSSSKPLVIIGNFNDVRYEKFVKLRVNNAYKNRVLFLGGIYNIQLLNMFRWNCYAYIHGHSVGGINPSLLEIMHMEKITLAYSSLFNKEAGKDSLLYFRDAVELYKLINYVENNYASILNLTDKMKPILNQDYSWSTIINFYDKLFRDTLNK